MSEDIDEGDGNVDSKRRRRNRFRKMLRDGALSDDGSIYNPLEIEKSTVLRAQLKRVGSQVQAYAILVDIAAYQPWVTLKKPELLNKDRHAACVAWCAKPLKCTPKEVARVAEHLRPRRWSAARIVAVVGIGGVATVLTAGVAAPAIGAALGGTMGLSGAAAVSAGLAWLGGGAVAAGGFGMAGGTFILGVAGGAAGAGLGTLGTLPKEEVASEIRKLKAFVSLCRQGNQHSRAHARELVRECERQLLAALDVASELRARSHPYPSKLKAALADARVLSCIDRAISETPLPVDPDACEVDDD